MWSTREVLALLAAITVLQWVAWRWRFNRLQVATVNELTRIAGRVEKRAPGAVADPYQVACLCAHPLLDHETEGAMACSLCPCAAFRVPGE